MASKASSDRYIPASANTQKNHSQPLFNSQSNRGPVSSTPSSSRQISPRSGTHSSRHFQKREPKKATIHFPTVQPNQSSLRRASSSSANRASSTAPSVAGVGAKQDDRIEDREEFDSLNEVVMAVDMKDRDTVGCCYYVAEEEKLYFMGDIKSGGIEVIDTLKLHAQPTVILLSSRIDDTVSQHLSPDNESGKSVNGDVVDQFSLPYILEVRPSPEFNHDAGKRKLANINFGGGAGACMNFMVPGSDASYDNYGDEVEPVYNAQQGKLLQLSGWIDLESTVSVGCAGAVLTYLQRRKASKYLPGDTEADAEFRVSSLEMFTLEGMMLVNADTLASLQIMQSESHPHTHNQGPANTSSGSKEGLSVYGLFRHLARTPQGRYRLRQYFLRPTLDLDVINERLNTASVFLRPDNDTQLRAIVNNLKHVKNIRTVLIHLRKGISNGSNRNGNIRNGVWLTLMHFAFHTMGIMRAFEEILDAEDLIIRNKVIEHFDSRQLANLGAIINEIVDSDASAEAHRTIVRCGVNEQLDEMKRTYDGIEDLLNRTSRDIASSIPLQFSLDLNVIFFPQIGFLISMPIDPVSGAADYEGGERDEDKWERIFSSRDRVYYKDYRMLELDNTFGDIYAIICDKEIEIIHELAQGVLEYETMLCDISDICGDLDSLLALAQGAREYKLSRPRMTTENIIRIRDGRHILQERTVPSYIPNDTFLVGGDGPQPSEDDRGTFFRQPQQASLVTRIKGPSMLMMTGPNYSGKSVYLKQIALIVYMAHVGCFVPADGATIGLTDKIMTRVTTRETVSKAQSAFTIDLQQVSSAINLATHRSLLIIDEFGKGTESVDGAGLACGVFEYLLSLGTERPKVLGATHFHEIFENGFLRARPHLAFGHMQVRVDPTQDIENQLTFLYNFRPGRSKESFGSSCAAMNGIDALVVNRAEELIILHAQGEDLIAACAGVKEQEIEDLQRAEEIARQFLAQDMRESTKRPDSQTTDLKLILDELL